MEPEEDTMQTALRVTTHVLPGHRVEIIAPELTDGDAVEVFVVMSRPAEPPSEVPARGSVWELIHSLPPGPRSAPTWEEIERTLHEDRDAWDR